MDSDDIAELEHETSQLAVRVNEFIHSGGTLYESIVIYNALMKCAMSVLVVTHGERALTAFESMRPALERNLNGLMAYHAQQSAADRTRNLDAWCIRDPKK
jgi:cell division protein FtsL